jgi:hypothetical protein
MKPVDAVTDQSGGMAGLLNAVADVAGRIRFIFYDEASHQLRTINVGTPDR